MAILMERLLQESVSYENIVVGLVRQCSKSMYIGLDCFAEFLIARDTQLPRSQLKRLARSMLGPASGECFTIVSVLGQDEIM